MSGRAGQMQKKDKESRSRDLERRRRGEEEVGQRKSAGGRDKERTSGGGKHM